MQAIFLRDFRQFLGLVLKTTRLSGDKRVGCKIHPAGFGATQYQCEREGGLILIGVLLGGCPRIYRPARVVGGLTLCEMINLGLRCCRQLFRSCLFKADIWHILYLSFIKCKGQNCG